MGSISAIERCLKEFHYTMQAILPDSITTDTDKTIQLRYEYTHKYRQLEATTPVEAFLFTDEAGFKVAYRQKRGRSVSGTRACTSVPPLRSRNKVVGAVIYREQLFYCKTHIATVNSAAFQYTRGN